jgi:hypothetical protein
MVHGNVQFSLTVTEITVVVWDLNFLDHRTTPIRFHQHCRKGPVHVSRVVTTDSLQVMRVAALTGDLVLTVRNVLQFCTRHHWQKKKQEHRNLAAATLAHDLAFRSHVCTCIESWHANAGNT